MTRNRLAELLLIAIVALIALPAQAVLKEKNFHQTLTVLRAELEQSYKKQKKILAQYEQTAESQHDRLILTIQKCNQLSLILYSQKTGFTFDMAYACQEATSIFKETHENNLPYDRICTFLQTEIDRYDRLINSLEMLPPSKLLEARQAEQAPSDTTAINQMRARLDSIAAAESESASPFFLNDNEQKNRDICIVYAKAMRENIKRLMNSMTEDMKHYRLVDKKVKDLNDYAQANYAALRQSIFSSKGDDYLSLLANLPKNITRIAYDINDKYSTLADKDTHRTYRSDWRGAIIPGTLIIILFYIIISSILSYSIIKWIVPERYRAQESFRKKQPVLMLTCGFIIFVLSIGLANFWIANNFISMAISLLLEFSWLIVIILISMLIRLNSHNLKEGVRQYTPFLCMALIVILFRIVFIPNNLVNFLFPPLLLAFTIWQGKTLKKRQAELPETDIVYTICSLMAMIAACVISWIGYTLMAVEVMIWWTFQLACIQTITCFYFLSDRYETTYLLHRLVRDYKENNKDKKLRGDKLDERIAALRAKELPQDEEQKAKAIAERDQAIMKLETQKRSLEAKAIDAIKAAMKKGDYIEKTWTFDLVIQVIIPIMAVNSVILSIYMAANIFDMTDVLISTLIADIVNVPDVIRFSIVKLTAIAWLFFIFRYLNYAIHSVYRLIKTRRIDRQVAEEKRKAKEKGEDKEIVRPNSNLTLANNVITILTWGTFIVTILIMLQVPKSGITIITTGLATGMGFAMKDLLENFFYGLSLMTGRIRIGDYIECEGISGKVDSITYQSTQVVTRDGSVIAFLNSQLFTKNFKNLTRNNRYEMIKIPVGVAYGTSVQRVRDLLTARINALIAKKSETTPHLLKKGTAVKVAFSDFGDNSVDLLVMAWVLVEEKIGFISDAKEAIYNELNDNSIEIPFPQRDIHIINPA